MRVFQSMAVAGLLCTLAGTASATTINSFNNVTNINGLTVSPAFSTSNLSYTITLNAGATFVQNSVTYTIVDVIGFYALADGVNLSQPSLSTFAGFSDDSDHRSAGSILGWKSNPNNGITTGNSQILTFPSLNALYTTIGFHVRISGSFPGGGNTENIRGNLIPTPGAAALVGLAGLFAGRRRR